METVNETCRAICTFEKLLARGDGTRGFYPLGPEHRVYLVAEDDGWKAVTQPQWNYSCMGQICSERATAAEKGELRVNGRRLIAEQYLKLWRQAQVIPIEALGQTLGFDLFIDIERAIAAMPRHGFGLDLLNRAIINAQTASWQFSLREISHIGLLAKVMDIRCEAPITNYGHMSIKPVGNPSVGLSGGQS
jgi:hypothetical protein